MVLVRYDNQTKVAYFCISEDSKVSKTIPLGKDRFLDIDENGRAVGFEVLFPQSMPEEAINAIIKSKPEIQSR